jgi:hypothetical protein
MIQNKANGKYLTIEANSTVVGAKTALGEDSGHASFDWQIYRKEEGYYRIQNRHSLNYLEIAGASTDAGAEARMGSYENQAQRLWELSPADDGYYRIINKNSGMSLEALDEPASGKSSVVQAVDSGADSQLWRLVWARE